MENNREKSNIIVAIIEKKITIRQFIKRYLSFWVHQYYFRRLYNIYFSIINVITLIFVLIIQHLISNTAFFDKILIIYYYIMILFGKYNFIDN